MSVSNPAGAAGIYVDVSADGSTGQFTLPADSVVYVASVVQSVGGGTLTVFFEMADNSGTWQQIVALPSQTAVGVQSQEIQPTSVNSNLTDVGRLRWTCSGGSVAFAATVIGE